MGDVGLQNGPEEALSGPQSPRKVRSYAFEDKAFVPFHAGFQAAARKIVNAVHLMVIAKRCLAGTFAPRTELGTFV